MFKLAAISILHLIASCSSKSGTGEEHEATISADAAAHDGGVGSDASTLDAEASPPVVCGGGCGGPPTVCGQCKSLCGCCARSTGDVVTLADKPDAGLFMCTVSRCYVPLGSDAGLSPRSL